MKAAASRRNPKKKGRPLRDALFVVGPRLQRVYFAASFFGSSAGGVLAFFFSPQPIANTETIVTVNSKPKSFFMETS
jgi:hypothetical protein